MRRFLMFVRWSTRGVIAIMKHRLAGAGVKGETCEIAGNVLIVNIVRPRKGVEGEAGEVAGDDPVKPIFVHRLISEWPRKVVSSLPAPAPANQKQSIREGERHADQT